MIKYIFCCFHSIIIIYGFIEEQHEMYVKVGRALEKLGKVATCSKGSKTEKCCLRDDLVSYMYFMHLCPDL